MASNDPQKRGLPDRIFAGLTGLAALMVVAAITGVFAGLLHDAIPAIRTFGTLRFVASSDWNPVKQLFGGLSAVYGTLVTTVLSLLFAVPTAVGIAIFVTEVAPRPVRVVTSGAIELLAAIPSIIYGMWGLFTLAPIMRTSIEPFLSDVLGPLPVAGSLFSGTPLGIDYLTAGLVLSIMIIPFVASISRDAFRLTPTVVKESAYALGATKWEVVKNIVIPYARTGVVGGITLAMGRALGETMAVAFVLGNAHKVSPSLFESATSITVTLANEFAEADSDLYRSALFELALLLFVLSFVLFGVAKLFTGRLNQGRVL